jgi:hypothetical protein
MSRTYLAICAGGKTNARMAAWNALSEAERNAKAKADVATWKAWLEKHAPNRIKPRPECSGTTRTLRAIHEDA